MKLWLILLRALFGTWHPPITWVADQPVTAILLNEQLRDNFLHLYGALRDRIALFHHQSTVTAGNAIAIAISTAVTHNHWAFQNPAANGDTFTQSVVLAKGSYLFYVRGRTNTDAGKIKWTLNGVDLGTQDWYAAVAASNVLYSSFYADVAVGGRYILQGQVVGQHASSTGFFIRLTKIWFQPFNAQVA